MAKKGSTTALKLVRQDVVPRDPAEPPPHLKEAGARLWCSVQSQYRVEDAGGLLLLTEACASLDRSEQLRVEIDRDGPVLRTARGVQDHPALKHEAAARALATRLIQRLGLDLEPIRDRVGRPAGPRGV
jgi:hypothetical protein